MFTLNLTKEEMQLVRDGLWALIVADATGHGLVVRPAHLLWEKLAALPPATGQSRGRVVYIGRKPSWLSSEDS